MARYSSSIGSELLKILRSIDTRAHIMSNNSGASSHGGMGSKCLHFWAGGIFFRLGDVKISLRGGFFHDPGGCLPWPRGIDALEQFNYPTTHPVFITPASEKMAQILYRHTLIQFLLFWKKIKSSMSETFEKRGQRLVYRRDRLATLYFTGKFEWPHSSFVSVMVEKSILRWIYERRTVVLENVIFLNRSNKSIYEPISKRMLIPRGHVTSEISHHSDIYISKFHSTLFRVIGFFRYAPKISLIRPRFFLLFFSSYWPCWIACGVNFIFFRRL